MRSTSSTRFFAPSGTLTPRFSNKRATNSRAGPAASQWHQLIFRAIANTLNPQAITGSSRHTVPAKSNSALVGTGNPGNPTKAKNKAQGRAFKNPSTACQIDLSADKSTPCRSKSTIPIRQIPPNPRRAIHTRLFRKAPCIITFSTHSLLTDSTRSNRKPDKINHFNQLDIFSSFFLELNKSRTRFKHVHHCGMHPISNLQKSRKITP